MNRSVQTCDLFCCLAFYDLNITFITYKCPIFVAVYNSELHLQLLINKLIEKVKRHGRIHSGRSYCVLVL